MKYIKTYEIIVERPEGQQFSPTDFMNIPYWRYTNNLIDCIMKVKQYTTGRYGDNRFLFKALKLKTNNFVEVEFNSQSLRGLIKVENKLLRPATKEEIEKFKFLEETENYNL